jgi:hypothetical protein
MLHLRFLWCLCFLWFAVAIAVAAVTAFGEEINQYSD